MIKRLFTLLIALSVLATWGCVAADVITDPPAESEAIDSIPAFPGAEGFGMYARGGRGGTVYVVTSLEDSGPGSLREAVAATEPRIIVFNVSGEIELQSPLDILNPYVTIAGQTAPGDGITITNRGIRVRTYEVILRYLRVRPGVDREDFQQDCIDIGINEVVRDVIIDHVSTSWGNDEGISTNKDVHNVTVQNCIIAENLGRHGFGSVIGSYGGKITFANNLYTSNISRNPRPAGWAYPASGVWPGRDIVQELGTVSVEFRNNIVYNWGHTIGYNGNYKADNADPDPDYTVEQTALISNYYRPGPDSNLEASFFRCHVSTVRS